ncbi:hypothetical protein QBC43DRAFT_315474 [Cladorrhinum sp. PSN259]|nr:hypothetical protein QBC43DRAFT_315474 [Cladorrhinum sp. PSN259]
MFFNNKGRKHETKILPPTPPSAQGVDLGHSPGGVPLLSLGPHSLERPVSVRPSESDEMQELRQENIRLKHMRREESMSRLRFVDQLVAQTAEMDKLKSEQEKLKADHAQELGKHRDIQEGIKRNESSRLSALTEKHKSELAAKEQVLKAKTVEFEKLATSNYNSARWWQQEFETMKAKTLRLEDLVKERETTLKEADELKEKMAIEIQTLQQKASEKQEVAERDFEREHDARADQHEREKSILERHLRTAEQKIEELIVSHRVDLERRDQEQDTERGQLLERIKNLRTELDEVNAAHTAQLKTQHREYQVSFAEQKQFYETAIRDREARHAGEMAAVQAQLKERILELEQELMNKPDDFSLGLDGSLKTKYASLKLTIETVTSPWNLGLLAGPDKLEKVDQTGFLERAGGDQWPFLLRAMVWARIMNGFFAAPYGFGSLGSGEGGNSLLGLYRTWKKLLDSNGEVTEQENFELFYQDKYANAWRSATFQSMLSAMEAAKVQDETLAEDSKPPRHGISKCFEDNRSIVEAEIIEVISYFCADDIGEEIKSQVVTAVQQASELSMAFGAHRAKVCFGIPKFGDVVEIGAEFIDCQDGDLKRGELETVELAVSPALFIIGDGKSDLTSVLCVQHGEIYPVCHVEGA